MNDWELELGDDDWEADDWDLSDSLADEGHTSLHDTPSETHSGQRVRDMRLMIDMSPEALADYAMINVKDLLAIEAGVFHLERSMAQLLADGMGVSISEIWIQRDQVA